MFFSETKLLDHHGNNNYQCITLHLCINRVCRYALYLVLLKKVVQHHEALDIPMFFGNSVQQIITISTNKLLLYVHSYISGGSEAYKILYPFNSHRYLILTNAMHIKSFLRPFKFIILY